MTELEKVVKGLESCRPGRNCGECPYHDLFDKGICNQRLEADALALLKAQVADYPICEKCGRHISNVHTRVFNHDGSDSSYSLPLVFDRETGCALFETSRNWTGYGLTDEEIKEDIRCPYCGKYPFDENAEVDFHEPVRVLMWTSYQTPEQMANTPWEGGEEDAD